VLGTWLIAEWMRATSPASATLTSLVSVDFVVVQV
jgi:hypothetical protein